MIHSTNYAPHGKVEQPALESPAIQSRWTEEEKEYLLAHKNDMMDSEIAAALGRHVKSVGDMRRKLSGYKNRPWTTEEEDLLCDCWGSMTIHGICKKLGRSQNAIMVRVNRLGLPPYLESGEYITMHQLSLALGFGCSSDKYFQKSWVEKRGFPVHNKRRGKAVIRVVYLEEFWPWAEKTVRSWTSPRWSLWRLGRNQIGWLSSAERTLRRLLFRERTRGRLTRITV